MCLCQQIWKVIGVPQHLQLSKSCLLNSTKLILYINIQSVARLSSLLVYRDVMSNTSFYVAVMEPLGEADPFCSLSLFQHTVCHCICLR